jgi:hypothetical protein
LLNKVKITKDQKEPKTKTFFCFNYLKSPLQFKYRTNTNVQVRTSIGPLYPQQPPIGRHKMRALVRDLNFIRLNRLRQGPRYFFYLASTKRVWQDHCCQIPLGLLGQFSQKNSAAGEKIRPQARINPR